VQKVDGAPRRAYWLITRHAASRMDVFTTHLCGDGKALAMFGFQEEAQMVLDLLPAASREGWRVRQTSVGELVSVLYGPCSDTKKVALDPVPEVGRKGLVGPLSMHRNEFLRFLLGEDGPSSLQLLARSGLDRLDRSLKRREGCFPLFGE
jgi:hypothetical protein